MDTQAPQPDFNWIFHDHERKRLSTGDYAKHSGYYALTRPYSYTEIGMLRKACRHLDTGSIPWLLVDCSTRPPEAHEKAVGGQSSFQPGTRYEIWRMHSHILATK